MLFVYLVLTMSMVSTCAPNKREGNARETCKGLLATNQEPLVPKLILNYKNYKNKTFLKIIKTTYLDLNHKNLF